MVFNNAIEKSVPAENVALRVNNLIDCITYFVFVYTSRGLFECDKLIFASQMTFQVCVLTKILTYVLTIIYFNRKPIRNRGLFDLICDFIKIF